MHILQGLNSNLKFKDLDLDLDLSFKDSNDSYTSPAHLHLQDLYDSGLEVGLESIFYKT